MILHIAIADSNNEYVERFALALGQQEEVRLSTYTDVEALKSDLRYKKIDVFLFDPSIYEGQFDIGKNTLAIMLLDDTEDIPDTCRDFVKVNKFQRVSRIYKQVLELYSSVAPDKRNILGQNKAKIIAVYSPIGGAGVTSVALAVTRKYASIGKKTFYLSFEDISSEGYYLPQESNHGMSDLAMHLGDNIDFTMRLKSLLLDKGENFYYLKHFDSPNDIYALSDDEVTELLDNIASSGLFDYVIVDMGTSVNNQSQRIFEAADKILLIERCDYISQMKMSSFLSQVHIINNYAQKMIRMINFSNGSGSKLRMGIPIVGVISAMQNPDPVQFLEIVAGKSCNGIVEAV